MGLLRVESNGEQKSLVIKVAKQRDVGKDTDVSIIGVKHPFINSQSFCLATDISDGTMLAQPIFLGRQSANFMSSDI
jgi:hypothetical protein